MANAPVQSVDIAVFNPVIDTSREMSTGGIVVRLNSHPVAFSIYFHGADEFEEFKRQLNALIPVPTGIVA